MFKKLFEIIYNNKRFLILVDKNHRNTFLEVVDGKYVYPLYEDYKILFYMYNNYDYTIKYSKNISYKEKVIYNSLLITLSALLTVEIGYVGKLYLELEEKYGSISIAFQAMYKDENHNRASIDIFFDNEIITYDDVVNVINANSNLNAYYKKVAIDVLDLNLALDPQANLRIYYENIKPIYMQKLNIYSNNQYYATILGFTY